MRLKASLASRAQDPLPNGAHTLKIDPPGVPTQTHPQLKGPNLGGGCLARHDQEMNWI